MQAASGVLGKIENSDKIAERNRFSEMSIHLNIDDSPEIVSPEQSFDQYDVVDHCEAAVLRWVFIADQAHKAIGNLHVGNGSHTGNGFDNILG